MLQTRPSDLPLVESSPPTSSMPPPLATSEQPEPTSEHVGGDVPGTSTPAPLAPIYGRLVQIERMTGERIAAYLQERGLSKVDSERIVADVSKPFAECLNQAMTPLEATQNPEVSLQDHLDGVAAKLTTCQVSAAQQTGIPLSVMQDALRSAVMASPPGAEQ